MSGFRLDVGSNKLSNKGHLLRLLCNETNLDRKHFGDLVIKNSETFIMVDKDKASEFRKKFKETDVKGHKIKVTQMS